MEINLRTHSPKSYISLLFPILGLFGVIYINNKWFFIFIDLLNKQSWIQQNIKNFFLVKSPHEIVAEFISPVRGMVFIFSMLLLLTMLARDVDWETFRSIKWPKWTKAIAGFLVLVILLFPMGIIGLSNEYAETSLMLFTKVQVINWGERFLLPALAHILFFRGPVFYFIFSLLCNLLLLYVVLMWFARNNISLSFWQFISLGTISFIAFEFYIPGYPDVLMHLLLLLALTLPISEKGWLILFALSMAAHEASVFIWVVLTFFLLDKRSWIKFFIVLGFYIFLRFASGGFDLSSTFAPHVVGGMTTQEWITYNFDRELLGIFFAFKAGWIVIFVALVRWIVTKDLKYFLLITSLVMTGLVMTLLGIDTSRLMGWAYPALLFSWKFLSQDDHPFRKNLFRFAVAFNLIIPPYYIGLNGIVLPHGLYKVIVDWFF